MRILAVSPVNPCPPSDGDSVRIYNFLKGLKARGHRINLVFMYEEGREVNKTALNEVCNDFTAVPYSRREIIIAALGAVFNPKLPVNAGAFNLKKFTGAALIAEQKFRPNAVLAYRLRGAACVKGLKTPAICDAVDSLALNAQRKLRHEKNPLKYAYLLLDKGRLKRYEASLADDFASVIFNFEEDADFAGHGAVIPNGAVPYIQKKKSTKEQKQFLLGFFGHLSYHPNRDGLNWFLKYIWKKLRESDKNIFLKVFGNTKSMKLPEGVIKAGFVPEKEFDREISALSCVVVPVRYGTGRQNKIMRSWACSVPVVGTPYSARGVYGKHGLNMLIGHTPFSFQEAIVKLKNTPGLGEKLAQGGMKTLKEKFNWRKSVTLLENELKKAIRRKK